jgi:hypothetical protein
MAMDRIWVSCPCCKRNRTIQNSEEYDDDYHYYYYCDRCWEYEYYRYWDAYHYYCHQWWHYYCAIGGVPASAPVIR